MNKSLLRGDIWLVQLDPTIGHEIKKTRPAMIISNNLNNSLSRTITIIPVTSSISKIYPFEVLLPAQETELIKDSKLKCDQIRTIDKRRFIKFLGKTNNKIIRRTERALAIHLNII